MFRHLCLCEYWHVLGVPGYTPIVLLFIIGLVEHKAILKTVYIIGCGTQLIYTIIAFLFLVLPHCLLFPSLPQGSVWSRLGSEVTCIEFLSNIGGVGIDLEIAKTLQRSLTKQGLKFKLNTKVTSASKQEDGTIKVQFEDVKKGKQEEVGVHVFLLCCWTS